MSQAADKLKTVLLGLAAEDRAELDSIFPPGAASGERYSDMSFVNR